MAYLNSNLYGINGLELNNQQVLQPQRVPVQDSAVVRNSGYYGFPRVIQQPVNGFGNRIPAQQSGQQVQASPSPSTPSRLPILCCIIIVATLLVISSVIAIVLAFTLPGRYRFQLFTGVNKLHFCRCNEPVLHFTKMRNGQITFHRNVVCPEFVMAYDMMKKDCPKYFPVKSYLPVSHFTKMQTGLIAPKLKVPER